MKSCYNNGVPKKKDLMRELVIKADLKALATKEDLKTLATKEEVKALDQKVGTLDQKVGTLDQKVGTLDQKVGTLDQKVGSLDRKVNGVALEVVFLKNEMKEVKENMMTKQDKNEITNSLDQVMGAIKSFEQSLVIRGHWKETHDERLDNHEERIKKLEVSAST